MVKIITIKRICFLDEGTFGVLFDETKPICLTLERRWLNNKVGESCIPKGEYVCKRLNSPKFGDTFQVCDVPGRSEILFHKGNMMEDSHGCIIVGEQFHNFMNLTGVSASGDAFLEFRQKLEAEREFKLVIVEVQ